MEDSFDDMPLSMGEIYTQYPGDPNQYPKGTPIDYPFPSQYFSEYSVGEIIGQSSNKDENAPLIVTSGKLVCDSYQGTKQAFTDTYNFRVLLNGMDNNGTRVGWTNSIMNAVITPVVSQPNKPSWAGMHLFARYRTEYDLYVASYRFDGLTTIKKKIAGTYTTLAQKKVSPPTLGETYKLQFTTKGTNLAFYINGVKELSVDDSDLSWGTTGVRLDYTDCYVEYLRMTTPKMSEGAEPNESEEGYEQPPQETDTTNYVDQLYYWFNSWF